MDTLLAHVITKHCSYLTLLHIDNQYHFLQCHATIFIPAFGSKMGQPGNLPAQIHI